jgi:hypothetical protein
MKLKLAITIAFLITTTLALALHTVEISMKPGEWATGTDADVSLNIQNLGEDSIVKIDVLIPESDNEPIYKIKEISNPAGWTYKIRSRIGQAYPYRITWFTDGIGITKESSLEFGLTVEPQEEPGKYEWKVTTYDEKGDAFETILTTEAILAPLSYFKITEAPKEVEAGKAFDILLTAFDNLGKVKTDYVGTVKFSSTDEKAILPEAYTFKKEDMGTRKFRLKLKVAGNQTLTVKDETSGISETIEILVKPSDPTSIEITPDDKEISLTETVEFEVIARDKFDNKFDVTNESEFSIDEEAGGTWDLNVYTPERKGVWTVTAVYQYGSNILVDGATLRVSEVAPVETVEEISPVEVTVANLSFAGPDSVSVSPGGNESIIHTGNVTLSNVFVSFEGVPSDWVSIYPSSVDIVPGDSKDFIVVITMPENETGIKTVTFTVSSEEGATAAKEMLVEVSTAPTGTLIGAKNFLQLGVVIIAVAAIIIIAWELWFKTPKSKK